MFNRLSEIAKNVNTGTIQFSLFAVARETVLLAICAVSNRAYRVAAPYSSRVPALERVMAICAVSNRAYGAPCPCHVKQKIVASVTAFCYYRL